MANTAESGFSPVRQFDPYTRPRLARWPIPGRLSQCLLQPVHVWLTAKLGADVPGLYRTVPSLAAAKFIHPPRPGSLLIALNAVNPADVGDCVLPVAKACQRGALKFKTLGHQIAGGEA